MPTADLENPDLPLSELMERWPETIPVFLRHRMLCVGCVVSPFHTLMDACAVYGLDEAALHDELRRSIGAARAR